MKENERLNKLIDEIQSLPEPDYEKEFNTNKQRNINDNLMKFSRNYELKKRRNALMKRFSAGVVGIAALILFSIAFIPFGDEGNSNETHMEFELYNGKSLRIAVVGEPPEVREEQIKFKEISFDELTSEEMNSYDAVFIMKENLEKASASQYKNIYVNSRIPYFFISSKSFIPFTTDIRYSDSWEWEPGLPYINGLYKPENNNKTSLGFGLYNDKKTEEHIKATYSLVFKKIEELNL
ncbi:hypothetical protein GCM10011351_19890 [Paraliobacillus quinghaiensis]|uniref:Uncharacterized protein n=1 Tax=Paraliobacillus quinghaiensis TaxID=470815 RepID=A0A917TT36_9BACI|nr:hypothetical protein [Paraliobacillus quinghaiensis]GGM33937.1 hypothetical protein GCM10011351_19890 [Paraliobacillus quinghaiensis]